VQDNINRDFINKSPGFDHKLWNDFITSQDRDEYCHNWINLQCSLIPEAVQGVLFLADGKTGSFAPVSKWPDTGEEPRRLTEIAERVIAEGCGLLVELGSSGDSSNPSPGNYGVAYPFFIEGKLQGLVAIEVLADREDQLTRAMGQLQWGIGWLELLFRREEAEEGKDLLTNLKSAVDVMALVLSESSFKGACMAFATQLAVLLKCDRISLAFVKKNHSRIQAVSHSARVGERMNLIRAIEMAMDEAIVQRKEILYPLPPDKEIVIVRNHEQLAKQHGAGSIFTMPLHGEGRYYGALTLERPPGREFSDEEVNYCRSVASLLFPVLETKRQNDRYVIFKVIDSLKNQSARFIGAGYPGRKVLACLVIFLISAETTLEGKVRRVIVAPFEGYVKEAPVRAGDTVEEGMIMCRLDDRDLRLERLNLISKQTQYQRQYQEAVAGHNRAEAEIIRAQLEQSAAQLEMVKSQIERTRITAPFRGIVLSGDLSQRLGGSAEKGEVLFEIAPLDSYRIILEIDERNIADIKTGQAGHMILSSLPRERFEFIVEKITPISTAKDGMNYFRVEAGPKEISERLRPGMTGVGKIYVGRLKLIDVWTRDMRDWLRLKVWSWWP
jgi:hypothetical protein